MSTVERASVVMTERVFDIDDDDDGGGGHLKKGVRRRGRRWEWERSRGGA